jgi:hypothetical protein
MHGLGGVLQLIDIKSYGFRNVSKSPLATNFVSKNVVVDAASSLPPRLSNSLIKYSQHL